MAEPEEDYVPEGWDPELQRFVRDDGAADPVVTCFVFENNPIYENEESE